MANLSLDENKLNVFTKGIDSHCLSAMFYWPQEAAAFLGDMTDRAATAIRFKQLVDEDHQKAKELRSRGKSISFGLAYGCFPPKVAKAAKVSLEEATGIFNAYHEELYSGVTKYREEYVLQSAMQQGYVHLGLGFRIYSDNPRKDIRTINNATCQFWSILTALAINSIHSLIDKAGYQHDVFVTSTIYDSIYFVIRDDTKIIKWVNDNIVPIMERDFIVNQVVKNSAELEIGPNWKSLHKLPQFASEEQVKEVRSSWS